MKCYRHMDTDSAGACSVCGRPVCGDCVADAAGRGACPECRPAVEALPFAAAEGSEPHGRKRKSSAKAFFLALLPMGFGHLYVGEYLRALVFFLLFVHLIGVGDESPSIGLLVAGLYFFQIWDAVRLARETQPERLAAPSGAPIIDRARESVFWAWFLIVVGVIFQLHTLNVLSMAYLPTLVPPVLVILGIKLIAGSGRGRRIVADGATQEGEPREGGN